MRLQQRCRPLAVQELRRQIARFEAVGQGDESPPISCGCNALDELLPKGGVRRGTLVEWLAEGEGTGAATLAVLTAREACSQGGVLVVVDGGRQFYPPAAVRLGIALDRLLLIHVDNRADHDWAFDQALRCPAVAAALAWPESLGGQLDGRTFRRLQLAAERSGSLGLLLRPAGAGRPVLGGPSFSGRAAAAGFAAGLAATTSGGVVARPGRRRRPRRGSGVRR